MKIAIVGAGLSGLATAFHLLYRTQGSLSIDIFDPLPIGQGTAGAAGGLLHPYPGKEAKRFPQAEDKLNSTHRLIMEASKNLNRSVILSKGILRPAISEAQIANFKKCADENPADTEWWPKEKVEASVPFVPLTDERMGGLYIKSGLTIDMPSYIEGLWQTLARLSVTFHQKRFMASEKELTHYDYVLYAMGPAIITLPGLEGVPISPVKGQILILKWPKELRHPPCSLVGDGYLIVREDNVCFAGSTHEHHFTTLGPDIETAKAEILRKVSTFFPKINELEITGVKVGIRASRKGTKIPLMGKISKKEWFITGLGGKGLLYHAWLGEILAEAILTDNPSVIPKEYLP